MRWGLHLLKNVESATFMLIVIEPWWRLSNVVKIAFVEKRWKCYIYAYSYWTLVKIVKWGEDFICWTCNFRADTSKIIKWKSIFVGNFSIFNSKWVHPLNYKESHYSYQPLCTNTQEDKFNQERVLLSELKFLHFFICLPFLLIFWKEKRRAISRGGATNSPLL